MTDKLEKAQQALDSMHAVCDSIGERLAKCDADEPRVTETRQVKEDTRAQRDAEVEALVSDGWKVLDKGGSEGAGYWAKLAKKSGTGASSRRDAGSFQPMTNMSKTISDVEKDLAKAKTEDERWELREDLKSYKRELERIVRGIVQEGVSAKKKGKPRTSCPYRSGSADEKTWIEAYNYTKGT